MSEPRNYYKFTRNEMIPLLPGQYSKVLEIGCGEGDFRDYLTQEHEYWGVEPAKSTALIASNKLDRVLNGTYQEMSDKIPDEYFDLIICNDVIEHMIFIDDFFQSIKLKLKKNGYLVASIPNVRYLPNLFEILVKKDWEYKDEGVLDKTHLRFFTEKSIGRIIKDNGFVMDKLIGINSYRADTYARWCLFYLALFLLGQDVEFLQFGIRIKN